jgi:hypothetical protein
MRQKFPARCRDFQTLFRRLIEAARSRMISAGAVRFTGIGSRFDQHSNHDRSRCEDGSRCCNNVHWERLFRVDGTIAAVEILLFPSRCPGRMPMRTAIIITIDGYVRARGLEVTSQAAPDVEQAAPIKIHAALAAPVSVGRPRWRSRLSTRRSHRLPRQHPLARDVLGNPRPKSKRR